MRKAFLFLIIFLVVKNLQAANSLSYSGRLVQANGAPVTGPVNLRAELVYTNATSTVLCFQDLSAVSLTKGVFHLKLDLNCAPKTMTQILSETPSGESVAIRIIDQTNSKTYPLQAIHSVPYSKVAEQLPQMGASNGQALTWDGSKWAPTTVGSGNGSVTTINTGTGLTGGPISTSGTISVAAGGITSTELANNSVTATKINAGEITSTHISATANIPYSKLQIGVGEIPQDRISGLAGSMSALIEDVIADAVTGKAPSQNAVYDALGLKADRSNVAQNITAATVTGLTAPIAGSDAANKTYVDNSATTLDTRITNEVSTINTALGNKYDKAGGVITGDVTLNTQLLLKGGANFVTVKANSGTANYVMTLPTSAGSNGYVLQTDGAGVLSWVNPSSVVTGSGTVNSASITDGSIVDADINASANIAQSKIANLSTDLASKQPLITAGTTAQYYRGDKTWSTFALDAINSVLSNYVLNSNFKPAVNNTDSISVAFGKLQKSINDINDDYVSKSSNNVVSGSFDISGITAFISVPTPNGLTLNEATNVEYVNNFVASSINNNGIWSKTGSDLYYNLGNVGVGTNAPTHSLTVNGDLSLNGKIVVNNLSNYIEISAPTSLASNLSFKLPNSLGSAGQLLSVDGLGNMSWVNLGSTTPSGTAAGDLSGTYPNPTVARIQGRSVTTAAPTTGQVLKYNGTAWAPAADTDTDTNYAAGTGLTLTGTTFSLPNTGSAGTYGTATQVPSFTTDAQGRITGVTLTTISGVLPGGTATGDLSGTYPNPTVARIQGRSVTTTAPTTGQVLKYNGTAWAPAADTDTSYSAGTGLTLTGTVFSLPNTGSAGTYGTATQVPSFTTDAQGRITGVTLTTISGVLPGGTATGDLSGTYPNPTVARIQGRSVTTTAPTTGQVLKYNGTAWAPAADTDTDTNTTYTAGTGLNLTGTIFSLPDLITAGTYLKVTVDAQGRVTSGGSLASTDIPSLDASKITSGTIATARLPATTSFLGSSIESGEITDGTIVNADMANESITNTKLKGVTSNCAAGTILVADGAGGFSCSDLTTERVTYTNALTTNSSVTIPESVIITYCGDTDGCHLRFGMFNWDGTGRTASRQVLFFYNGTTKTWRSESDAAGTNGTSGTEHAYNPWSCYLTDGAYLNGTDLGDVDLNFALLNWTQYSGETCSLTIID